MSQSVERRYRPEVDGLRAVCIVLVVGFHAGLPGFAGGFVGVDMFFVISGFVIIRGLAYERASTGRVSWRQFYLRRVRRLVPVALVVLAAVLVLSGLLLEPANRTAVGWSALAAITSTANLYFLAAGQADEAGGYFAEQGDASPLLHMWSLAVEEQFYLALPVVVTAALLLARSCRLPRRRAAVLVVVVLSLASVALSWWLTGHDQQAAFYLPFTRVGEFGVGALVALVSLRRQRLLVRGVVLVAGIALIVWPLVHPAPAEAFPGLAAMVPCLGTALVITARPAPLALAPVVAVGKASYGWYLWHVPVLVFAEVYYLAPLGDAVAAAAALSSLLIAAVTYRLVEQPWRRSGPGSRRRRIAGSVAVSLALLSLTGAGAAAPAVGSQTDRFADFEWAPDECRTVPGHPLPSSLERCELTEFDPGRPTVVVRGDSHAWQIVPAILEERRSLGADVNVVAWVMASCPPLTLDMEEGIAFRADLHELVDEHAAAQWDACVAMNYLADKDVAKLQRRGTAYVVAAARWTSYRQAEVLSRLEATGVRSQVPEAYYPLARDVLDLGVDGLVDTKTPTTVVAPAPELRLDAKRCLAMPHWRGRCDLPREDLDDYASPGRSWLSSITSSSDVAVVDLTDSVCDDSCPGSSYIDDSHLRRSVARELAPHFVPAIRAAAGQ